MTELPDGGEALRRALADGERRMAAAMQQLVASPGFSALLGQAAQNAVSLTAINSQLCDMVLRNLRIVGHADLHRLARRLNTLDDKLELLLQQIEHLDQQPEQRRDGHDQHDGPRLDERRAAGRAA
jgi:hypothetical protein